MTSIKDATLITDMDFHIDELKEQLAERDSTIAQLRAEIAALRAQLNTVPVDCIRRFYTFTHYDAAAANDAEYTTQQFDSDDMWIGIWLESLEDAA